MTERPIDARATAFGRAIVALMEARGIPAEPDEIRALAERSGLDGDRFLARAASAEGPDLGDLGGLAREMGLSEPEMEGLAMAYAYEKELPCAVPGCERPALLGREGMGECQEHAALFDARAEEDAWGLAGNTLRPWVESAREIGSDELTEVMEGALVKVEEAVNAALDEIERAEAALGRGGQGAH